MVFYLVSNVVNKLFSNYLPYDNDYVVITEVDKYNSDNIFAWITLYVEFEFSLFITNLMYSYLSVFVID